ncbi:MAG: sulfite exporter TauE/SafE family protein [Phycisphaerales bacterium]|nr:MAG: sulfite exporter TauE/SafE family protein [Phycisphaerales bacterium]
MPHGVDEPEAQTRDRGAAASDAAARGPRVRGVIGLVAGLTGTGGGIFLSPLILLFRWADPKQTAAAAALFVLINSVSGLSGMAASGWTPHPSLALLAVAAGIGGLAGSYIGSRRATPRGMCLALAAVLLLAGGKLVLQ